jgi:hypothetical protein
MLQSERCKGVEYRKYNHVSIEMYKETCWSHCNKMLQVSSRTRK